MNQKTLCIIFGILASTISRVKIIGIKTILNVFEKNKNDSRWKIRWHTVEKMKVFNETVCANSTNDGFVQQILEGEFAFADGLNLRIKHLSKFLESIVIGLVYLKLIFSIGNHSYLQIIIRV